MTDIFLKRRQRIERRIAKIKVRITKFHRFHGGEKTNYHEGWRLGYWQGQLSILEELLEDE